MNSTSRENLGQDARCVLDTLLTTHIKGIGYSELENRLCSILTLLSDYDVIYKVNENLLNGVSNGYSINIYNYDFEDIRSLDTFLYKAICFLDNQIRETYLSELEYEIKSTDNVSKIEDLSDIMDNIAIITDYNEVKKELQLILSTLYLKKKLCI